MIEISTQQIKGVVIVSLKGELDASSALAFDNKMGEVIAQQPKAVLIDCAKLEYTSSPGIGVLISRHGECQEKNISFALCNLNPKINNALKMLGLDQLITIYNSTHEAKSAMGAFH
ncbi:MAG: STAS domain-containing protein [Cytophagales bacterium]|nr:STAS domain-containing protein [Bernardetiaceae bacterium]MDW8211473.1 STAS domain-containing protein [Cytophagales bacterium]